MEKHKYDLLEAVLTFLPGSDQSSGLPVWTALGVTGGWGCMVAPVIGTLCWANRSLSSRADTIFSHLLIFIFGIKYV